MLLPLMQSRKGIFSFSNHIIFGIAPNLVTNGFARFVIEADGTCRGERNAGTINFPGEWFTPVGFAPAREVRATHIGGELPTSGDLNTWSSINGDSWEYEVPGDSSDSSSILLIEIRNPITLQVEQTAQITLRASGQQ